MAVLDPVVLGLGTGGVPRQAARLAQLGEALTPAGEDLVYVGLVAGVPQQDVARRVEHAVEGERQLDHAEVRAQVTAGDRDGVDDERPDLAGEGGQLLVAEVSDVRRTGDLLEQHV